MASGDGSRASLSILIVEDDLAAIGTLGVIITRKFPKSAVYLAYDGAMGLELFKEQLPDIVVTDINMPKMDGIEMAQRIKEIRAGTKVIVLTAYSDKIVLERFREIGISQHILKPVEFYSLFAAIDKAMAEIVLERQS